MQRLGMIIPMTPVTNLIIHNCITNISSKTTEFICILHIVEKTRNLAVFYQQF